MVNRRDKLWLNLMAGVVAGALLLLGLLTWFLWQELVGTEERRLSALAVRLGEQTEATIVDARDMLEHLSTLDVTPCSPKHLQLLQEAAIKRPHIRAIGYWRAADRLCDVGFIQGFELRPARADRIYHSGVIAWWPSEQTQVGTLRLFLMRFGDHDVAIDPRMLLDAGPLDGQQAGLWVEGLRMASNPPGAELPAPEELPEGLSVDRENRRILARFSLGTVFPIDIVAVQPIQQFWQRYLPTLIAAGVLGVVLLTIWAYAVLRYSRHRLSLTTELRNAIARKQIRVEYQPIVSLTSGRCIGAEALARWVRDDGEVVSPDVFIPVAEKAQLVSRLTLNVLDSILHDLGDLLRSKTDLIINLNLSSQDLESGELVSAIAERLQQAGVSPGSLKLEITERALIDSEIARSTISALRARGHHVAIDDFGTGYSSLSYLETFELDTLKIDKVFVVAIETHAATSGVITHVIEMARTLEMDIVAEGIELLHQVEWLRDQGVEFGQGYYFSRPLSARRFVRYVSEHR